ncbi:hypothetical protein CARUB_v10025124mg [Capsella rubella]|uniref:Transcription repressor n=1 Tax=Capsella rubella TaxID=81985 RepID=R0HGS0_9BRAS|nr:transcription repressor OFP15 [Capsella rubella]EOA28879.1 hypothetical protein CARUB_v10025124mg [Capsella rubella]
MKLPFLTKNNSTSSNSNSSSSSHSSSSWPWPSCNQEPKTMSFRATITFTNPIHDQDEDDELDFDDPPEISESIEKVIKGLRSSERLIFESKGETNSILEEATSKQEEDKEDEEEGFMLLSLDSHDPYTDFKRSMEEMVEANALHHDWKCLETLLLQFLKVNAKASHRYIFAAFVDLLVSLAALHTKNPIGNNDISKDDGVSASRATAGAAGEASTSSCCNSTMTLGESPSSPLSFYTSCSNSSSSSDETSSTSVRFLPLSSLLEIDEKTNDILV